MRLGLIYLICCNNIKFWGKDNFWKCVNFKMYVRDRY